MPTDESPFEFPDNGLTASVLVLCRWLGYENLSPPVRRIVRAAMREIRRQRKERHRGR